MTGRSAFSYLASKISTTRLVALQVLIGSWAKQVFSLSALVILGLSCRLVVLLMGRRILSIVIVFSWKSNTAPRLCIVNLIMMRSYIGAWSPGILYDIQLKADLLAGRVLHNRDFNVTHHVCDNGAIGSAPRLRDKLICNGNAFTGPFFHEKEVTTWPRVKQDPNCLIFDF